MYLVKNGVPWDVANDFDEDERAAAVIAMARFDGAEFDFSTGQFRPKKS